MNKIISYLLLAIILVAASFFTYYYYQQKRVEKLEQELIELMKVQTPIKFKVTERENDTIRVKLKYYNLENEEIAAAEYNLKGSELAFDFYVMELNEKNFGIPCKLFTDKIAPKYGVNIAKDYNSKGFPEIFFFKEIDKKKFEDLMQKYDQILRKNYNFGDDFGNTVHDIKEIKQFEVGVVYKIIIHSKGGIEIVLND